MIKKKKTACFVYLSFLNFANASEKKIMRKYIFSQEILLNTYYVPGIILGIGEIAVKRNNSKKTPKFFKIAIFSTFHSCSSLPSPSLCTCHFLSLMRCPNCKNPAQLTHNLLFSYSSSSCSRSTFFIFLLSLFLCLFTMSYSY